MNSATIVQKLLHECEMHTRCCVCPPAFFYAQEIVDDLERFRLIAEDLNGANAAKV